VFRQGSQRFSYGDRIAGERYPEFASGYVDIIAEVRLRQRICSGRRMKKHGFIAGTLITIALFSH
jgi:hypothetical protein